MSRFEHYDLGTLDSGRVVEISLSGNAANVRLMDDSNFRRYKRRQSHRYVGGLVKRSPVRLKTNKRARWHVTVDLHGLAGRVRSSVKVLPAPLPPHRDIVAASPEDIKEAVLIKNDSRHFDVFISHASEDKEAVVRPLAAKLQAAGLRVWYDEFEMRVGDSLRRKIDHGISRSRFGVVILSPAFIKKGWTAYELDGIVALNVSGKQSLLPIWHDISFDEVATFSPTLADRLALDTNADSIDEIARKLSEVIKVQLSAVK